MLKKLDSLLFYVADIKSTAKFYRTIGFEQTKLEKDEATFRFKDFYLQFFNKNKSSSEFREEALSEPKGSGLYICIEVEDIDEYYDELIEEGLKPSSEPRDWPWGNREFVIRDPDGYKLVFYQPI